MQYAVVCTETFGSQPRPKSYESFFAVITLKEFTNRFVVVKNVLLRQRSVCICSFKTNQTKLFQETLKIVRITSENKVV